MKDDDAELAGGKKSADHYAANDNREGVSQAALFKRLAEAIGRHVAREQCVGRHPMPSTVAANDNDGEGR
ncbi:hypothetical protein [Asticcacaulis sp.]|uniref:hypothetical protein n=1 Tax=Asticcacaulis sp. TaxID=1872648 RepID=UPI0039197499